MADIQDNEAWHGHSGLEVETYLKRQIGTAMSAAGGKIGWLAMVGTDLVFYDSEGGTALGSVSLGGDVYNINIDVNLGTIFYVLADEATKMVTITPTTTHSTFGSTDYEPYPEGYTYVVAVNTGGGYINRITGTIDTGGSATFDIRPFLATGDNYVRVAVTGTSSNTTRSVVLTATVTTLTMSCTHTWQNVWNANTPYIINGIRFAGSLVKTLHVAVDGVEQPTVEYSASQSYTTTSTTYTIPASAFPASSGNGVHAVTLWMTAQGVSTPTTTLYIMCVAEGDTTPMVCVNNVTPMAVNYTSAVLFSYAVYNADTVSLDLTALIGSETYSGLIPSGAGVMTGLEAGTQYPFSFSLEIDTGTNEATTGTLTIRATPSLDSTIGDVHTVSTSLDNTYSYIATPGALFYMNAATRDNAQSNRQTIVNELGASQDGRFAATYQGTWTGFNWFNDGWANDTNGTKALVVPAGSVFSMPGFAPLQYLSAYDGITMEMMIQSRYPSDYSTPVFEMKSTYLDADQNEQPLGIIIYPTRIVVLGSSERSETLQGVNLSENRPTHITITWVKNYENVAARNLCSVYINGISNASFSFTGSSSFGNGNLVIGQDDTDAYLYRMRFYGKALSSQDVLNNFLNSIVDGVEFSRREVYGRNDILEGNVVKYDMVKAAGYNTMIVEMDDDNHAIPSFQNQASYSGCSMKFEYSEHPEWNVYIRNIDIDGQGTTSKRYFRWNLRGKTNDLTIWEYGDGTAEVGKEGYFAGHSYVRIDRVTAKKNIASSPQGHKMGLTGLYDDLYAELGLKDELPDDYRVAVYQFPFVGFRHYLNNDTYEFIGLYTAGPDKGSKVTFGYLKSPYPNCMSLEGPNHAPRGTRFLHPWVDITYSTADETLKYGGEEGWDCDYISGYSTDKASDEAGILARYVSEWKPAYEVVFNNSPYIVSANEMITALNNPSINSISALCSAANKEAIFLGSTNGYSNQLLSFYDSSYELYFYRTQEERFVKLSDVDSTVEHNVVTALRAGGYLSTNTPTTAQIIAARAARFKATMGNYWSLDQTLYHYCFCLYTGAKDNFAKNSYPFKFRPLSSTDAGNRWGWRQDDLDSIFATDNNGQQTVKYSVEHGDTVLGVEVFQGGNSALWVLIRDNYQSEIRTMMGRIANAAASVATRYRIQGDGLHNSFYNLISYHCWDHSAKYFAQVLYESDRRYSYIEPWLLNDTQRYNGVLPLTQALGDQYQDERLWVERRIAYMFSKYRIGAFTGQNSGYGDIEFTLAEPFTFNITPAIDLYPVVSLANSADSQGTRTQAGQSVAVSITADGQTTNYIHGADWLAKLGDLSGMLLSTRGGSEEVSFGVNCQRLQELKIGAATREEVDFNAKFFSVTSPALKLLDARNTGTIQQDINLFGCPRLRKVLFAGSSATGLLLPVGAKLNEVSFPSAASVVFMHSLPTLTNSNLTLPALAGIRSLYINNCDELNPLQIAEDIINATGEEIAYATLIWDNVVQVDADMIEALSELAQRSGYVDYGSGGISNVAGTPILDGKVELIESIPASDYRTLMDIESFEVTNADSKVYIDFVDATVKSIAVANWDSNSSDEIELEEAKRVTTLGSLFRQNTTIVSFDELQYFTGLTTINGTGTSLGSNSGAFYDCTQLQNIILPSSVRTISNFAFANCSSLGGINLDNVTSINQGAFQNASSLGPVNAPRVTTIGVAAFSGAVIAGDVYLPNLTTLNSAAFYSSGITSVSSLGRITSIPGGSATVGAFAYCSSLESVVLPDTVSSIASYAFYSCSSLADITFPNRTISIATAAFYGCGIVNLVAKISSFGGNQIFRNCTSMVSADLSGGTFTGLYSNATAGAFLSCTKLASVILPTTCVELSEGAFRDCSSLKSLTGTDNITRIYGYSLHGCRALNNVSFPKVTAVYSWACYNCSSITRLELPSLVSTDGTTTTNSGSFALCSGLQYVDIGPNCTTIGQRTFQGDTALATLIVRATTPPTLGANVFLNGNSTFKVYVPYSSDHSILDAYKAATNWSSLSARIYELTEDGNIPS